MAVRCGLPYGRFNVLYLPKQNREIFHHGTQLGVNHVHILPLESG